MLNVEINHGPLDKPVLIGYVPNGSLVKDKDGFIFITINAGGINGLYCISNYSGRFNGGFLKVDDCIGDYFLLNDRVTITLSNK